MNQFSCQVPLSYLDLLSSCGVDQEKRSIGSSRALLPIRAPAEVGRREVSVDDEQVPVEGEVSRHHTGAGEGDGRGRRDAPAVRQPLLGALE